MQLLSLNRRWAVFSVAVGYAVSALAWVFNPAWFLTLPGTLLTLALFGREAAITNRPLRAVLNIFATSILLYLGAALWTWGNGGEKQPAPSGTRALLIFWLILLVPWMVVWPLSGMAFDGGATAQAYVFFWSALTYPVSVALAAFFRRWFPYAVILPVVNFAACFGSSMLHK
jgi:hypothetical protein